MTDEEKLEVPWADRYRTGDGKMAAFLPGGSKFEGELYGGDPKVAGPVKKPKRRKGKAEKNG